MKKLNKNSKKYQHIVALSLVSFVAGLLLILVITSYGITKQTPEDTKNTTLLEIISQLETENEEYQKQIDNLRIAIEKSAKFNNINSDQMVALNKELDQLKIISNLTEVKGKGLTVTLEDNKAGAEQAKQMDPQNYNPNNFIIHDTNLRYLINDVAYLSDGIAINNQRVTSTTDIRCVGTVIMVNSTRLAPPYVISFIGEPNILQTAVESSQIYKNLKDIGMPIKIEQNDSIALPTYTGVTTQKFSSPADEKTVEKYKEEQEKKALEIKKANIEETN